MKETEIKLQVEYETLQKLKYKLKELGWDSVRTQFQRTHRCWRLDRALSKTGVFPRTRMTKDLLNDKEQHRFTVKRKIHEEKDRKDYFIREELDIDVNDAAKTAKALSWLGMSDQRILEKKRKVWIKDDNWKPVITFDIIPEMGCFVEIEGEQETIEQLVIDLGLRDARRWSVAYWDVYKTLCKERKVEQKKDLVFNDATTIG